jgi:hypothetical protein
MKPTLTELVQNFKPKYPIWLLMFLKVSNYNKHFNILNIPLNSRHMFIISYLIITIIMIISYESNDRNMTPIVWIGLGFWILFCLTILLFICYVWYNNSRIKKLCNKYGYTIQDWNTTYSLKS